MIKRKIILSILFLFILPGLCNFDGPAGLFFMSVKAATTENDEDSNYEYFVKYKNYLGYQRRKKYRAYKKYKEYKKYKFDSQQEREYYKDLYEKYKLYKKDSARYRVLGKYYEQYKRYNNYQEKYTKYKEYKDYDKYKKYDQKKYARRIYAKYNKPKYKRAYDRYIKSQKNQANLGGGNLGPKITIGLYEYTKSALRDDSFRIYAYKADTDQDMAYTVKDSKGNVVANIEAGQTCRVKYDSDQNFRLYNCLPGDEEKLVSKEINFVASNSSDEDIIVFDTNLPITSHDDYRGAMKLSYYDASGSDADRIWAINTLPLEQYVWGMGEITGTGHMDYNRVMTISYRTYGYWKIKYSTKYAAQGFKVNATPGNQLYYGYNHEISYPRIREAAIDTRGKIVMYKDEIAITPYSSWTDGHTRSWQDRWGSDSYPWCQSVKDPYGKHPSMSTKELVAAGNHMVGLSAHGALDRAEHGWSYSKILHYYYDGITIHGAY